MGDSLALDTIGQIHITVDDVPRAVAFYRDTLGMRLLFEVPEQSMAFFDCGGIRLYLGRAETPDFRSSPLLYYRVPDVKAAHVELESRGVAFDSPPHVVHRTPTMELWMAGFRDPSGNHLMLMAEEPVSDQAGPPAT